MMRHLRRVPLSLVLLAALVSAQDSVRALTILHTNDLHARLLPDSTGRGGWAYLATAIRQERSGCDSCLLLNAGDLVEGTPVSTLFHGVAEYEIANRFGFDASTLGNHEFDFGWEMIPKYLKIARFPVVLANVVDGQGRLLAPQPYIIRRVNGIRVAVIGIVMDNLLDLSTPDRMGPWRTLPVIETLRKYAAELRDRSDLIVALSHLGVKEGREILCQIPEVAAVVSGHPHQGLQTAEECNGHPHVEVAGYGRELGRLDIRVDLRTKKLVSWTWKRIPIDSKTIPPAQDVAALVSEWEAKVSQVVDVPIGEAKRDILQPELRRLIEQAMAEEMGADFAYINAGAVRDRLPRGRLLARHVWNVMPFDNLVVMGKFKGSQLPAAVTAGRSIDPQREYKLAVGDFTAINQKTQLGVTGLEFPETGPLLRDLLIDWIKKRKVIE